MGSKLISIVVPMYFEEKVVDECYRRLTEVAEGNNLNYEIIFVNDGSTDRTFELLEKIALADNHIRVLSFSRNFGHQIAVTAGMDKAKGEAVIIIDADLQDPPQLIPEMIKLWEQGNDVVYGKRKKRDGEGWFKLATAKAFYRILNRLSSVKIPIDTGDFRLIDRKVVEAMKRMPEHNRFLRGMSSWVGFKQVALEYERQERFAGETKYPLRKMIRFALDGIFSFSSKPLKLMEYLGLGSIVIAAMILVFLVASKIWGFGIVSSDSLLTLMAVAFMGGIQLLSTGLVGEYVVRIYDESRGRPLYIIDREINRNDPIVTPIYSVNKQTHSLDELQGTLHLVQDEAPDDKTCAVK